MSIYGVDSNNSLFSFETLTRQKALTQASQTTQSAFSSLQDEDNNSASNNQVKPHSLIDQNRSIDEYDFTFLRSNLAATDPNDASTNASQDAKEIEASNTNELPEFNVSVLEKIKSGMSFQDAISVAKAARFEFYFEEALANNGGDVKGALKRAEAQLSAETQLTDEEIYGIVKDLAAEYTQAVHDTGSQELQRIADELGTYLEELESKTDIEKNPILNKSERIDDEELALKNQFIAEITAESKTTSQNNITNNSHKLSEKELREREAGIKQYEKVANLS